MAMKVLFVVLLGALVQGGLACDLSVLNRCLGLGFEFSKIDKTDIKLFCSKGHETLDCLKKVEDCPQVEGDHVQTRRNLNTYCLTGGSGVSGGSGGSGGYDASSGSRTIPGVAALLLTVLTTLLFL